MLKEFLQAYHAREEELRVEFNRKYKQGEFGPNDIFPPRERFYKLREPYGVTFPGMEIWPEVPLYGSLIITLFPVQDSKFESNHGFDPRFIDQLIDLCKDTGRIQFVLGSDPLLYESMDYLEPILTELKPPVLRGIRLGANVSEENIKRWGTEFDKLARIKFYKVVESAFSKIGVDAAQEYRRWFTSFGSWYVLLRSMDLGDLVTEIDNALIEDPMRAFVLLGNFGTFFLAPRTDPLKPVRNFPKDAVMDFVKLADRYGVKANDITMPCEIGSFLMENLTYLPMGIEACKDLISHFDHRDYYTVMKAINDAAVRKDANVLGAKSEELKSIFKLVWEDAGGVKTKISVAKFLIPVGLGAVGIIASSFVGVLGALGFLMSDKAMEAKGESLSEKIVRSLANGSTFTIFDFKRKYGLDRRPI